MEMNSVMIVIGVAGAIAFFVFLFFMLFVCRFFVEIIKLETARQKVSQEIYKNEIEENKAKIRALFKREERRAVNDETNPETRLSPGGN